MDNTPNTPNTPATPTTPTAANFPAANRRPGALWASAFVLLAIVMIQAQPLLAQIGGGSSHSGMVSQAGGVTVMTADAGGDDVLLVLEGRTEELFVYRTDRNGIQLQQRMSIPKLFQDAKAMSLGR